MDGYNGVIQNSTGYLFRAGFCDFQNDGSFDVVNETYDTNLPFYPGKTLGDENYTNVHRWTGTEWEEVVQP